MRGVITSSLVTLLPIQSEKSINLLLLFNPPHIKHHFSWQIGLPASFVVCWQDPLLKHRQDYSSFPINHALPRRLTPPPWPANGDPERLDQLVIKGQTIGCVSARLCNAPQHAPHYRQCGHRQPP